MLSNADIADALGVTLEEHVDFDDRHAIRLHQSTVHLTDIGRVLGTVPQVDKSCGPQKLNSSFLWGPISLLLIATDAGSYEVLPRIEASSRPRKDVIDRSCVLAAVRAHVAITMKDRTPRRLGYRVPAVANKLHVDVRFELDFERPRQRQVRRADLSVWIRDDDLRLVRDDRAHGALPRHPAKRGRARVADQHGLCHGTTVNNLGGT